MHLFCGREVHVDNMDSRWMLWQKYVQLQVFNQLCLTWAKSMLGPTIASITSSIAVCFYITIRHNDVPPFLIPVFFYVGITLFAIVFWGCVQVINVSKTSQSLIGTLTIMPTIPAHAGNEYEVSGGQELKKYIMRKGKATRPMYFRLGDFMEVSIDVPIGIWDEILNQVLLLLSF